MPVRIKKINQLLKKELSRLISREVDFSSGSLVTLTRVDTSPNLIESKVFISVFPEEKQADSLEILKKNIWSIQQMINKRLRMRPIPKIIFLPENKTAEAGKVEEILEKLNKLKKEEK